ncbi:hypothetical protein LguiB_033615 [Lonicera macranthoides]
MKERKRGTDGEEENGMVELAAKMVRRRIHHGVRALEEREGWWSREKGRLLERKWMNEFSEVNPLGFILVGNLVKGNKKMVEERNKKVGEAAVYLFGMRDWNLELSNHMWIALFGCESSEIWPCENGSQQKIRMFLRRFLA